MIRRDRSMEGEERLLALYRALDQEGQRQWLEYGDFLAGRHPAGRGEDDAVPRTPIEVERPQKESVVKAIQRLSRSYPMLDKGAMLHSTSALLSQHVMQGRPAVEVIDDLELLFRRHYDEWAGNNSVE